MPTIPRPLILASLLGLTACPAPQPAVTFQHTLRDALLSADKSWTMVPVPSAALLPGTLVKVDLPAPGQPASLAIHRLGALQECGVPTDVVVVNNYPLPTITVGTTYALDASVAAKLPFLAAQLGGNASGQTGLTIGGSADSNMEVIPFQRWATSNAGARILTRSCGQFLSQPGVYVVQEAFVITNGTYVTKRSAGGSATITPPPTIPVDAHGTIQSGSDSSLTITQPTVFAMRVLQPMPQGGFQLTALATASLVRHRKPSRTHPVPLADAAMPRPQPLLLAGYTIATVQGVPEAR